MAKTILGRSGWPPERKTTPIRHTDTRTDYSNLAIAPTRSEVNKVGPQSDGSWVLGPHLYFDCNGRLLESDRSQYLLM